MTSAKHTAAVRIAHSLQPAELAMNQAALRVLAVGTAVLTARADGTFHPLEGQIAVDCIGEATQKMFAAMKDIKRAHRLLRATGEQHDIIGQGDIFQTPDHDEPRGAMAAPETLAEVA